MSNRPEPFRLEDVRGRSPVIIVFAPSDRSPAFEGQLELLEEEGVAEKAHAVLVTALHQGTSRVDGQMLDKPSADELRTTFGVEPEEFRIVLLGPDGTVLHRDDAPLQPAVIVERLSDGTFP